MFVATFKFRCLHKNLLEINQSLQEIAEKVKKLEGCADARVYEDTKDNSILYFVQEWQKQRHLDDHMKSSLFAALLGIKGLLAQKPEIKFMSED